MRRVLKKETESNIRSKLEFSKLIFISIWVLTVLTTVAAYLAVFLFQDTSILSYLIPANYAELATGTAFYYNKAKLENKLKIMKDYDMKVEKEDIE